VQVDPVSGNTVWEYRGTAERPLYSWCCGTAHRLDGGDTLIVETQRGRALQVTPAGDVVWEFVVPHRTGEAGDRIAQLFDLVRLGSDFPTNWVTRESPRLPAAEESVCRVMQISGGRSGGVERRRSPSSSGPRSARTWASGLSASVEARGSSTSSHIAMERTRRRDGDHRRPSLRARRRDFRRRFVLPSTRPAGRFAGSPTSRR
jgi:hypothetical protein